MKAMKLLRPFTMLDDAPWTWGYKWSGDAYEDKDFFEGADVKNHEVYYNVYDQLDDSPVTWHITEPVDVGEYQNEWLGSVINIY